MGLDMYLEAEMYFGNWEHQKGSEFGEKEAEKHRRVLKAIGLEDFRCGGAPSLYVTLHVAYWRKANHIHRWFVENCCGGKDDCRKRMVSREKLEELVKTCEEVLGSLETVDGDVLVSRTLYPDGTVTDNTKLGKVVAQPGLASRLLPTQAGFFFGGTDYDAHYLEDIRSTIQQVRAVLDDPRFKCCDFYYQASW